MALCVQLEEVQFRDVGDLHQLLLEFLKASVLYNKIGVVVCALPPVMALRLRQRRNRKLRTRNPVVCHLSWVIPVEGLWKTNIMVSLPGEEWRCQKLKNFRGLGHEPDFIETSGEQRDELVPFFVAVHRHTWRLA